MQQNKSVCYFILSGVIPIPLRGISNPCQHSLYSFMSHYFAMCFLENFCCKLKSKGDSNSNNQGFSSLVTFKKRSAGKLWFQTHPKNRNQQCIFTTFWGVNCNKYNFEQVNRITNGSSTIPWSTCFSAIQKPAPLCAVGSRLLALVSSAFRANGGKMALGSGMLAKGWPSWRTKNRWSLKCLVNGKWLVTPRIYPHLAKFIEHPRNKNSGNSGNLGIFPHSTTFRVRLCEVAIIHREKQQNGPKMTKGVCGSNEDRRIHISNLAIQTLVASPYDCEKNVTDIATAMESYIPAVYVFVYNI